MMHFLLSLFLFGTWTSVFSLGKIALEHSTPLFVTAIRMLAAAVILIGYLIVKKKNSLKLKKKQILPIILLAIFSIYLTNVCEFWGLKYLSSSKTCFIYSLSPFLTAFFSYLHFKEKMNFQKWIGMIIGILGIVPVLFLQTGNENQAGGLGFLSWPALAVMGAALFSVYGWVLLRLVVKDNKGEEVSPLVANGYSMLIGGALALIHSFMIDTWNPVPVNINGIFPFAKGILIIIFLSNILCYNLYGYLLKKFTATFLSFIGLLSPFFTSITSWLLIGEKPSWTILLSTTIVISGLFLVYKAELKQGYIKKKQDIPEIA